MLARWWIHKHAQHEILFMLPIIMVLFKGKLKMSRFKYNLVHNLSMIQWYNFFVVFPLYIITVDFISNNHHVTGVQALWIHFNEFELFRNYTHFNTQSPYFQNLKINWQNKLKLITRIVFNTCVKPSFWFMLVLSVLQALFLSLTSGLHFVVNLCCYWWMRLLIIDSDSETCRSLRTFLTLLNVVFFVIMHFSCFLWSLGVAELISAFIPFKNASGNRIYLAMKLTVSPFSN